MLLGPAHACGAATGIPIAYSAWCTLYVNAYIFKVHEFIKQAKSESNASNFFHRSAYFPHVGSPIFILFLFFCEILHTYNSHHKSWAHGGINYPGAPGAGVWPEDQVMHRGFFWFQPMWSSAVDAWLAIIKAARNKPGHRLNRNRTRVCFSSLRAFFHVGSPIAFFFVFCILFITYNSHHKSFFFFSANVVVRGWCLARDHQSGGRCMHRAGQDRINLNRTRVCVSSLRVFPHLGSPIAFYTYCFLHDVAKTNIVWHILQKMRVGGETM